MKMERHMLEYPKTERKESHHLYSVIVQSADELNANRPDDRHNPKR